ncbi:nuclease sbcCD subunit D [Peptoclostridium acidaminophilum DSM 3953]|uniref:Nuclease SbcCD subunit D n=1 Tax=Peptoclostridium acidaminophilum DSM 3953 TaxID=1286171 RepID=W8T316_PEPAC|nr:exonuclease SbcCD subunit D [Peptoclostridium acidaminophilum]AHM56129.1 nuclease sbcCD subunit D [Peptoclostridium acidaminophilum DSM 3953]
MKIIHTSDWHIGKIVNGFSMLEDQKHALEQLVSILEEERPHALVIAGDIYDRSIPPVEAVELLDCVLSKILLELEIPVLVIAGNHDSPERLSFGSRLLSKKGLHIAGVLGSEIKKVQLNDEFGPVDFYLIPYSDPREARHILADEDISTHDDAMRKITDRIKEENGDANRSVAVAHGYVAYSKKSCNGDLCEIEEPIRCESERPLSVGGSEIIEADCFESFCYAALGHLHGPQRVGSEKARYSGSLLKYSFSEASHKKGVIAVDIDEAGNVETRHLPLEPLRDMRVIKGPLKELINPNIYSCGDTSDYVFAILADEGELFDPISKLRAVYPNIMGLERSQAMESAASRTAAGKGHREKSKLELFEEFYVSICGRNISEEGKSIVKEAIDSAEKGTD